MILKKTYFFDVISSIITPYKTKSLFLILILLPSFFVSIGFQTFNHANASSNLGESIDQFRNNLQSSIDKQIQSNRNNNNNVNCDSNTNFSIQSQTNNNGQTTSTSKTQCGVSTSTISSLSLNNVNLKGAIVSSEYNTTTGVIVNSLFGNWSLTTRDGNFNGFNSSFTKQPVFYNSNNAVLSNSTADTSSNNVLAGNANPIAPNTNTNANPIAGSKNNDAISSVSSLGTGFNNQIQSTIGNQQDSNLTSYDLSNFRVNAINQQNNDTTYHGKVDVVREVQSLDTVRPDETNTFKDINTSVSILGNRILVINFDNQTNLLDEFTDIPLVGIVK
jgi:hypothetical protein